MPFLVHVGLTPTPMALRADQVNSMRAPSLQLHVTHGGQS